MARAPESRMLRLAAALAAVLAVAVAAFGQGHGAARTAPDPALAAFLAAGGSLGDLCLDGGGHGLEDRGHCAACQPASPGAPALPSRSLGRAGVAAHLPRFRMAARRVRGRRPRRAQRCRAPPLPGP